MLTLYAACQAHAATVDTLYAQINHSVAHVRSAGNHSAELVTQVLMGMPVLLLQEQDGWWRIQCPDGYEGWVSGSAIINKSSQELSEWRSAPRLVVTALHQIHAYSSPDTTSPYLTVTDLLPGCIVEGTLDKPINDSVEICLPDGRKCWAPASALTPIDIWAAQDFDADVILNQAYALEGSPYLWGGTSALGTDCSGLVKVSYLANALILRRDASQQALTGMYLNPEDWRNFEAGDLMFFGDRQGGRVTHVAIYDSAGNFIHSSGNVHRNSIDPDSPNYYQRVFLGGCRIKGNEGTDGITLVRDHPWYFNH